MASLSYLIKNRVKFSVFTIAFYKSWAKRLLTLPELLKRNRRRRLLLSYGAVIDPTAEIGDAVITGKKANLTIGSFSFIGRVEVALHDKVFIGKNVCINDGVKILTASHDTLDSGWNHKKKPIILNDYCWVATNAIILPGVEVGVGAVIGAGCVISKSVPAYAIVVGNPAIITNKKRVEYLEYNPCEFLAANNAWLK